MMVRLNLKPKEKKRKDTNKKFSIKGLKRLKGCISNLKKENDKKN